MEGAVSRQNWDEILIYWSLGDGDQENMMLLVLPTRTVMNITRNPEMS